MQQIPLDFTTRPAMERNDFLISPENQTAISWIDLWPDWPAPILIISGAAASGKSHLAAVWQDKTNAELITPVQLTQNTAEDLSAIAPTLVIDGLDPWLGDRDAETTLFHLYNILKEEGRSMLITMRMSPSACDFTVPDLASRFRAAPVATIQPPDDMLLTAILIKLFHDRQLRVGEDVIRYILPRMERSFEAAEDLVMRADQMALAQKRKISIPVMRDVLSQM